VVCESKSPEGQNRAGRGRVLRKGERRSSLKGQKSAESRALRLLSAVGATGVPVAGEQEHSTSWTSNAGLKIDQCSKTRVVL